MTTLSIRTFEERDRESVISLWELVFPDDPPWNAPAALLNQKLKTQPELTFVAEEGGKVCGTLLGGYDGVRGWMYHLATHPDFRRRGVARSLITRLERELSSLGCTKINLQVRAGNSAVTAFYASLGYETEPRVSMGKRLV